MPPNETFHPAFASCASYYYLQSIFVYFELSSKLFLSTRSDLFFFFFKFPLLFIVWEIVSSSFGYRCCRCQFVGSVRCLLFTKLFDICVSMCQIWKSNVYSTWPLYDDCVRLLWESISLLFHCRLKHCRHYIHSMSRFILSIFFSFSCICSYCFCF